MGPSAKVGVVRQGFAERESDNTAVGGGAGAG